MDTIVTLFVWFMLACIVCTAAYAIIPLVLGVLALAAMILMRAALVIGFLRVMATFFPI